MKAVILILTISLCGTPLLAAGIDLEDLRRIESSGIKSWSLSGVGTQASVQMQRYIEQDAADTKRRESPAAAPGRDDLPKIDKVPQEKGVKVIHLSK